MRGTKLIQEPITREIIGAFYEVYTTLGFGFLEHIYVMTLERELRSRGHWYDEKSAFVSCTRVRSSRISAST